LGKVFNLIGKSYCKAFFIEGLQEPEVAIYELPDFINLLEIDPVYTYNEIGITHLI